jgi:succinate dehydrogenase hydrophobic anchor subunit
MTLDSKRRVLRPSERGLNLEMLLWYFVRLSALAMYGLILIGLVGALIMGARTQMNFADVMRWTFMPTSTHVQSTNVPDLAPWSTAFWKVMGSALLLVAAAHGARGLVVIFDDYISSRGGRRIIGVTGVVCLIAMSVIGLYVVWTA